jgi:WD40 repeat protein
MHSFCLFCAAAVLELDGAKLKPIAEVRTRLTAPAGSASRTVASDAQPVSLWVSLPVACLLQAEKSAGIKCCTFAASSFERRHLATGDYNGFLQTWDLERLEVPVFSVKAHQSIINTIDGVGGLNIGYGAPELVTGSRDGCVKVWDVRQTEAVVSSAAHPHTASTVQTSALAVLSWHSASFCVRLRWSLPQVRVRATAGP